MYNWGKWGTSTYKFSEAGESGEESRRGLALPVNAVEHECEGGDRREESLEMDGESAEILASGWGAAAEGTC